METIPNWKRAKTDPDLRRRLALRGRVMAEIRRFFLDRGFLEADTPLLVRYPGTEPNLDPFRTSVRDASGREFSAGLITSPEYSLKKLLAGGFGPLFQLSSCFRNGEPWSGQAGGEGGRHNPEFTMLEWYRPEADYTVLMSDMESLASAVATAVLGRDRAVWQGTEIDLSPPWPRMSVAQAFERHAGIDLLAGIDDPDGFRKAAEDRGIGVREGDSFDDVFFRIFLRDIEPVLGTADGSGAAVKPVILYDYPRSMAALARLKPADGRLAERFEAYCGGLELANAFSELTDAEEQRRRLEAEREERRRSGRPDLGIDGDFLEAVGMMPEAAGIAFGVDRLIMLLTDSRHIRDVLFFPVEDLFS
ncbi:EF-P lysine aminoacylase GenX [Candidatus Uhrbacteria bacterium]|nr:EF-P lysine aminoacylase GenX [Candidatus Uhrbacteria bacterium]